MGSLEEYRDSTHEAVAFVVADELYGLVVFSGQSKTHFRYLYTQSPIAKGKKISRALKTCSGICRSHHISGNLREASRSSDSCGCILRGLAQKKKSSAAMIVLRGRKHCMRVLTWFWRFSWAFTFMCVVPPGAPAGSRISHKRHNAQKTVAPVERTVAKLCTFGISTAIPRTTESGVGGWGGDP